MYILGQTLKTEAHFPPHEGHRVCTQATLRANPCTSLPSRSFHSRGPTTHGAVWLKEKNGSYHFKKCYKMCLCGELEWVLKASGVWPSVGCPGQYHRILYVWLHLGKYLTCTFLRVWFFGGTSSFDVLLRTGSFGNGSLSLRLGGVTATGAAGCSLLVLHCPLLFTEPLFPLYGPSAKLISPFFN